MSGRSCRWLVRATTNPLQRLRHRRQYISSDSSIPCAPRVVREYFLGQFLRSFHAERGDGVDVRGPSGGNPAGDEGDCDQECGDEGDGDDVPGLNAVEQRGGEAGGGKSEREADGESDEREAHASAYDHGLDLRSAGSERHADAD